MKKIFFVLALITTPIVIGYAQTPEKTLPHDAWDGLTPDQVWFIKNF